MRRDFGHEIVAEVDPRSTSDAIAPGTIVAFDPHMPIERSSGFAELLKARGAPEALRAAFPVLPMGLSPDRGVFMEPLACAAHAIARLSECIRATRKRDLAGLNILVLGAGLAGALQGLVLSRMGARTTLANRTPGRLEFLRRSAIFGPIELLSFEATAGRCFDAVLISTSFITGPTLQLAFDLASSEGIVLLFGGTQPGQDIPIANANVDRIRRSEALEPTSTGGKRVWLAGTHGATPADFSRASAMLTDPSPLALEKLISARIRLAELPDVLAKLGRSEQGYCGKTVVEISSARD